MRLPHRLNLQLPLPPLRRHQVDPSLVQLRLKCGSGGVRAFSGFRCGRRGEQIGTFPRHFRGRDRGWDGFSCGLG